MRVVNIHQRHVRVAPSQAAFLLDGLSSADDRLWPAEYWPRMRLDAPLRPGASGGHGPIRYVVTGYEPGRQVSFDFTAPRGFNGRHWFEVLPDGASGARLRHTIEMTLTGPALLSWPFVFRPLHDALIEDALDKAQVALGGQPSTVRWSVWVRLLRWALDRRQKRGRGGPD